MPRQEKARDENRPLSFHGRPGPGRPPFGGRTAVAGKHFACGASAADYDGDGRLDLYVLCYGANELYHNNGDGTFTDVSEESGLADPRWSLQAVWFDYNGDGRLDVFVVNYLEYDKGAFRSFYAPTGYLDLYVANGDAHKEFPDEAVLARNDGKGNFIDVAKKCGDYFHHKYVSRGATWGDIDNDGDLDLLVCNLNDSPRLLRNDGGNRNHWVTIEARLPNGKSDAIGARITVVSGSLRQIQDLIPVRGYLSQGDPRMHYGLGKATKADRVEIRWPNGKVSELPDVNANKILRVVQPAK